MVHLACLGRVMKLPRGLHLENNWKLWIGFRFHGSPISRVRISWGITFKFTLESAFHWKFHDEWVRKGFTRFKCGTRRTQLKDSRWIMQWKWFTFASISMPYAITIGFVIAFVHFVASFSGRDTLFSLALLQQCIFYEYILCTYILERY